MRRSYLFNLPSRGLNAICYGSTFALVCLGVNLLRSSKIAVKVADTQILTSTSTEKLEELSQKLQHQAELIEQKDTAYRNLRSVYNQSLKGEQGYGKLQQAIEIIEELPEVANIEAIQTELTKTERELKEEITR